MPQINEPRSGHAAPPAQDGFSWMPFSSGPQLAMLRHAVRIIDSRVNGSTSCDAAFSALPKGRSFAQVWADRSIWISHDPANGRDFGGTHPNDVDVTITAYAFRMGVWSVAGTLIHELAHTNGADGISRDAENTLTSCLLDKVHDPTVIGMIRPLLSGRVQV